MIDFKKMTKWDMGKHFDYAILPKDTTEAHIRAECKKAITYNCKAFCFSSSYWTRVVAEELEGTDLLVGAGIGFPFGQQSSAVKAFETEEAVRMGATVLDNCMNVGALKDKKYKEVLQEFKDYKKAAGPVMTKMILDTEFLTGEEIKTACKLIAEAEIDWAKSATGQWQGPSMEDVLMMVDTLKDTKVKVKVSGVKFPRPQNAYAFLLAGAELIGSRSAPEIIDALDMMRRIKMIPEYEG
ncbi:deoxyribose-phosphate aldolase [Acetobacterium bakii]|uniref:Deoxyribose-phosphate aldolase n=1 Tax=Acetobacterium bakii TaxID=52689 RepID=A0A0L6U510_9FIRM|nr:deoxyribose-phosphate aldolase [Acetobacterium bakii]KNZ42860.1 deoxyribose-phosphate aldolase [Acetobacterium bakii]